MNALFVLMTTNYTLNPSHYFLGDISSSEGGTNTFMLYFPVV